MSNFLRCRRGTVAFATAIALVPLIGVVALGAEAGSWYVIRQNAQNAADAAAYSGALRLACGIAGSGTCDTANDYIYRGKQFADQNKFCDPRTNANGSYQCVNSPPTGTTQTVVIDQPTSIRVRATVAQQQPAYLATILGLSTVNIGAQAIAEVQDIKQLCGLGLGRYSGSGSPTSALIFAGNESLNGNGCGLQSNTTIKLSSSPTFNGTGWALYAAGGCQNGGSCTPGVPYNFNMSPAQNPLAAKLDSLFTTYSGSGNPCGGNGNNANISTGQSCIVLPNTPTTAYSANLTVSSGGTLTFQTGGTYFFKDSAINLSGTVTGTNVNIVLLGNSSLSITGGPVSLSANFSNALYPALNGILIDDQAPNSASLAVTINGSAGVTLSLGGTMYFPNVDVTMSGNSHNANTACTEVIANSLNFSGGSAYLSTSSCANGTVPTTQVVALVQ